MERERIVIRQLFTGSIGHLFWLKPDVLAICMGHLSELLAIHIPEATDNPAALELSRSEKDNLWYLYELRGFEEIKEGFYRGVRQ